GKGKRPPPGKAGKKRKTHRGYLWGYHAVEDKLVFFDYSPSREADNPMGHLKGFAGVLQTDCYDVYDQVRKRHADITHYHCLNHSRREFEKALGNDAHRAGYALERFQELYAVERKAAELELDAEGIRILRDQQARPVLEGLFTWMEEESPKQPPSSPIAKAMGYMLKRKGAMTHYLSDGRLLIDNNPIENLIRPIAVGRKNYLFAGSHDGAQYAAVFYSFFACCKLNGLDPTTWLADVMNRLPNHPVNRIEELLPHRWNAPAGNLVLEGV
ncbi:MAG TPA: IS66 family transposase, partial [Saprospiraceae bacterium]|nr:IS66 family transposase [Saprospiraceae bacterium]